MFLFLSKMSKRISGGKRLQVIQNWLNGKDDDEWEVFPTKTEGKYFVKPRKNKLKRDNNNDSTEIVPSEKTQHISQNDTSTDSDEYEQQSITSPKRKSKNKHSQYSYEYDPTVNIEILNQLKQLGEEMKNKREQKEQKRIIKEVFQKQMAKRSIFQPNIQYDYPYPIQQEEQDEEDEQQPINNIVAPNNIIRRRNHIFADLT